MILILHLLETTNVLSSLNSNESDKYRYLLILKLIRIINVRKHIKKIELIFTYTDLKQLIKLKIF